MSNNSSNNNNINNSNSNSNNNNNNGVTYSVVNNNSVNNSVNINTSTNTYTIPNTLTMNSIEDKDEFTLDMILVRIGQFGKFQLIVFLLICIPMLFNAIFSVTYIFTSSPVVQRCNITECDTVDSKYDEPWTKFSIPIQNDELDQCNRYMNTELNNQTIINSLIKQSNNDNNNGVTDYGEYCRADYFDTAQSLQCPNDNFIFRDREVTIANDFGIYCDDEWKLAMVGTVNNIGQFVGIPIGGFIADRFGRRTSLALGGFVSAIIGIIRSFSPDYLFFLIFEFLDNLASSTLYSTCFIVGIELVGPQKRVIACSVITIFYAIGEILLAVVAKYFPNWRVFLRIVYIPALIHITFFWILPESVRWLLSQGKEERAKKTLQRAAKVNGRRLSDNTVEKLLLANRNKLEAAQESRFPIKEAFSKLFWRIANCSFCWIVNVFVYYGLSLSAVRLGGDKYVNFMLIALVEIPGFLLPYVIMDRFGRRYSLFGSMLIAAVCCLLAVFIDSSQYTLTLIMFLIGKMTITTSFQVLYFFTSEIFPTNLRNSLLSFCSMIGRFGSMLAPQTSLLAKYYENAPSILFAASATLSGCLALFFPETTNLVLPSTMKEADDIGLKKKPIDESTHTVQLEL